MSTFPLQIISPEGTIFTGEAEAVTVRGIEGSLGVWANHAPMIAALVPGIVLVRTPDEENFLCRRGRGA